MTKQMYVFLVFFAVSSSTYAQVFIKDESSASLVVAPTSSAQNNLVTQTVYGFLDFTTTIGNTVMVFSPQSSSVVTPAPASAEKSNVIETRPSSTEKIEIKPSKTEARKENKSDEKKATSVGTLVKVKSQSGSLKTSKVIPTQSFKVNVITGSVVATPIISSKVQVIEQAQSKIASKVVVQEKAEEQIDEEPAIIEGNHLNEPEFEFFSRQPSEVVEETYRVVNLKPSSKFILKHKPASDAKKHPKKTNSVHPTGLVTKLGGTVIKDGTTTVHETSVIGTYISGKYAQVLQSSSRILDGPSSPKAHNKIIPTPSQRILKTAAPNIGKKLKLADSSAAGSILDETEVEYNNIKTTRKPNGQPFKLRYNKNRSKESQDSSVENKDVTSQPNYKKSQRARSQQQKNSKENTSPHRSNKPKNRRTSRKRKTSTTTPSSVHSEETSPPSFANGKRYQSNRRNKPSKSSSEQNAAGYSRRAYKPKIQTSTVEQGTSASTSLYKFKLNRSPGRWQYKTTPKPRVTIRKQAIEETFKNETQYQDQSFEGQNRITEEQDSLEGSESVASIIDDEGTSENKVDSPQPPSMETLKVEISTPPDFKDIYFEIATIKSPYTFQVGSVKNTRFITVTSTFERSLVNTQEPTISPTSTDEQPLTENILVTSSNYEKDNNFLDSSLATLPPIYLASDVETPPLETLTETFSTTHTMLKTHILPVIRGPNDTLSSTLVQTYLVTRLVTATKTLPPMEAYHFNPSKTLNEFNSHLDEAGSEFHLELEYGDQNEQDFEQLKKEFPPDLDLSKIGSNFDISEVDKSKIPESHLRLKKHQLNSPKNQLLDLPTPPPSPQLSPEQLQQLALLRLLNPNIQPQVITTSKPVVKIETLYESHVIPVTNGPSTLLTTLSKIKGTVTKTDYEIGTSTIAPAFPQQIPQVPIPPPVPQNPFFQQPIQPQFSVTSSPIVQTTTVTQTIDKVLKLTFGAKTAYTTVISTTVVPTVLTTYVTASVPVQPTAAAFPGYFPAPYPQFPFVG